MTGALHTLDQDLSLQINGLHSPFTDGLWQLFSDKTFWFPMYALLILFLVGRLGWKKALACTLGIALTIVLCDQSANLLKYSVGRLRPCYSLRMLRGGLHILEGRGSFFGFFSAHAANAFGLALCSLQCFRLQERRGPALRGYAWFIFVWAFLVSASRIFAGKHYLGDVLVGIAVGLFWGWLMGLAVRRVCAIWPKES